MVAATITQRGKRRAMCTVCSDARRVTCLVMNNDTRLEMNETEKELEVPWEDIEDKWDDGVVVRAHGRLPERASASDRHALGQRHRCNPLGAARVHERVPRGRRRAHRRRR
jgi:hypothetical protein